MTSQTIQPHLDQRRAQKAVFQKHGLDLLHMLAAGDFAEILPKWQELAVSDEAQAMAFTADSIVINRYMGAGLIKSLFAQWLLLDLMAQEEVISACEICHEANLAILGLSEE